MRAQVRFINRREHIAGRRRRIVFFAKQISDAAEDVAAVIERNHLQSSRYRHARLQIDDRESVAADRDGERIQDHRLLVLIDESADRDYCLPRPGFFEIETA